MNEQKTKPTAEELETARGVISRQIEILGVGASLEAVFEHCVRNASENLPIDKDKALLFHRAGTVIDLAVDKLHKIKV